MELIDGLLVEMSPKSREHELAVERLADWLADRDRSRYRLRTAAPLSLADGTEPEPDVAVVATGAADPYHPATAELVIEVAVSSLHRDLVVKASKYADAGVPLYLVVDLAGRRVIEHADPRDGAYRSVRDVEALDARNPRRGASAGDRAVCGRIFIGRRVRRPLRRPRLGHSRTSTSICSD